MAAYNGTSTQTSEQQRLEAMLRNLELEDKAHNHVYGEFLTSGAVLACQYGVKKQFLGSSSLKYTKIGNEEVLIDRDVLNENNESTGGTFGVCKSPKFDGLSMTKTIDISVSESLDGIAKKEGGHTCYMQLAQKWSSLSKEIVVYDPSTQEYREIPTTNSYILCYYGQGCVYPIDSGQRITVNNTGGSENEIEDHFVIIKRGTLCIRRTTSAKDDTNILAKLSPGKAIKVVLPYNKTNNEGISWIQVNVDDSKTEKGWVSQELIYPDKPIEMKFLNHQTIDFTNIIGEFNGNTKTQDYIAKWGAPGKGDYPKGQQKYGKYFLVAVAPKILYPEYPDTGAVEDDDFAGFSKYITVHLRHEDTHDTLDIPCYVDDFKAHSYSQYPDGHGNTVLPSNTTGKVKSTNGLIPNGLIQTGIAYPKSTNAKKDKACDRDSMNGNIVEFCGWEVTDFDCNKYELVSITSNEIKHS